MSYSELIFTSNEFLATTVLYGRRRHRYTAYQNAEGKVKLILQAKKHGFWYSAVTPIGRQRAYTYHKSRAEMMRIVKDRIEVKCRIYRLRYS